MPPRARALRGPSATTASSKFHVYARSVGPSATTASSKFHVDKPDLQGIRSFLTPKEKDESVANRVDTPALRAWVVAIGSAHACYEISHRELAAGRSAISNQALQQWLRQRVPAERLVSVSDASGVPFHELRPDIHQKPKPKA